MFCPIFFIACSIFMHANIQYIVIEFVLRAGIPSFADAYLRIPFQRNGKCIESLFLLAISKIKPLRTLFGFQVSRFVPRPLHEWWPRLKLLDTFIQLGDVPIF